MAVGLANKGVRPGKDDCEGCEKIKEEEKRKADAVRRDVVPTTDTMPAPTSVATDPAPVEIPPHVTPDLYHNLKHESSVLCLAVGNDNVYTGTEDGEIFVWSLATFHETQRVQAHNRSVMCLFLSDDGTLLFSSASDPIINVWCPKSMSRIYEIYSTYDSFGDIYSVAYSSQYETAYFGTQNASLQWVPLNDSERHQPHDSAMHPDRRNHRFFDSRAVGGANTPRPIDERHQLIPRAKTVLEAERRAIRQFAHYGYIYTMIIAKGATAYAESDEEVLISGGGDGTIKVWRLGGRADEDDDDEGLEEIMVLGEDNAESVCSLAIDGSFLYSGKNDGFIELWDLDTKQKLRVIKAHQGDVMGINTSWGYLWSAAASGTASKHSTVNYDYSHKTSQHVSQKYQCLTRWKAHDAKVLASAVTSFQDKQLYITGSNDNNVSVWLLKNPTPIEQQPSHVEPDEDMMVTSLREFVSYKTISSRPEYAEDCRRGATFLRTLFRRLGGDVEMLHAANNFHHPVVFAKFSGKGQPAAKRKRILFYGHYDVVAADTKKGSWNSDPFQVVGTNGYLYGRGVSDNKGPIMAALYAVTDLMQARSLNSDILFLIEGEEESGSRGFKETVRQYKDRIGHIDYVLLANSYWINDQTPCLTYGLRGVLHATVCVESKNPDLHSGVDGSYMNNEPLTDLTTVISRLKGPKNHVLIPGFYDGILPLTPEEEKRYDDIATVLMEQASNRPASDGAGANNAQPRPASAEALKASLMARWREPNLTIHRFKVSGPDGSLVSSHASANISFRLVPGQELDDVIEKLSKYLEEQFGELESDNKLTIRIDNKAEPWLGQPENEIFQALEEAVLEVWKPLFASDGEDQKENGAEDQLEESREHGKPRAPLYIREGGSIPAIRFLEKEFDAPAAHLPCGQASDAAHLNNERLRIMNLVNSREIFRRVFGKL